MFPLSSKEWSLHSPITQKSLGQWEPWGSSRLPGVQMSVDVSSAGNFPWRTGAATGGLEGESPPSLRKTALTHSLSISISHLLGSQGNTGSNTGPGPTFQEVTPQNECPLFREAKVEPPPSPNPVAYKLHKRSNGGWHIIDTKKFIAKIVNTCWVT